MTFARLFVRDVRGSMSIELCIMTPILVWVLISTFVYFDLFRTEANVERASITVADLYSRETEAVTDQYIDTTVTLLQELTYADDNPLLRVTAYTYDEPSDTYQTIWSEDRGFGSPLLDTDLDQLQIANRLPLLGNQGRAILVETQTQYVPLVSTDLSLFNMPYVDNPTFNTFTVVQPRFQFKRLCFAPTPTNLTDVTNNIC